MTEPLYTLGGLAATCSAYVSLVDNLAHGTPEWFTAALFFYINSFQFTDCLHTFVDGCLGSHELRVPTSDALLEKGSAVLSWLPFPYILVRSITADVNPSIILKPIATPFKSLHGVTAYCTLLHCVTAYYNSLTSIIAASIFYVSPCRCCCCY